MYMSVDQFRSVLGRFLVAFWAPEPADRWNFTCASLVRDERHVEECRSGELIILLPGGIAEREATHFAQDIADRHAAGVLLPASLLPVSAQDKLRSSLLSRGLAVGFLASDADLLAAANAVNRARMGLLGDLSQPRLDHTDALQELIDDLGRLLHNSVVCFDLNMNILAASPVGKEVDLVRQEVILHRRGGRIVPPGDRRHGGPIVQPHDKVHVAGDPGLAAVLRSSWPLKLPANPALNFSGRIAMRIALDGEVLGILSVTDTVRALGEQDSALIRDAAHAAARILSKRLATQRETSELRKELLEDIVHGRISDPEALQAEAEAIGWDADCRQQVIVVAVDDPASLRPAAASPPSQGRSRKRLAEIVRLEGLAVDPDMLLAAYDTSMVIVVKLDRLEAAESQLGACGLPERIVRRVAAFLPDVTVSVGVGRAVSSLDQLAESFRQAHLAAQLATSTLGGNRSVHYDRLGIYRLLHALKQQEHAVPDALKRLVDHDARHGTEYVRTLAAYFAQMGRLTPAAKQLRVHRRTLEYRVSRISAITGVDPNDPEQRLLLELGIKLLELDAVS
jgi:sugar diacid utilization regulator